MRERMNERNQVRVKKKIIQVFFKNIYFKLLIISQDFPETIYVFSWIIWNILKNECSLNLLVVKDYENI